MSAFTSLRGRKRLLVGAAALAVAVGVPAGAIAATSSGSTTVHTQVLKGGTIQVSGYDGGAALGGK